MVTLPAQGTVVPFPFLGAQCCRGMTGTDLQSDVVVYVRRDFWTSHDLLQRNVDPQSTADINYWKALG